MRRVPSIGRRDAPAVFPKNPARGNARGAEPRREGLFPLRADDPALDHRAHAVRGVLEGIAVVEREVAVLAHDERAHARSMPRILAASMVTAA